MHLINLAWIFWQENKLNLKKFNKNQTLINAQISFYQKQETIS